MPVGSAGAVAAAQQVLRNGEAMTPFQWLIAGILAVFVLFLFVLFVERR